VQLANSEYLSIASLSRGVRQIVDKPQRGGLMVIVCSMLEESATGIFNRYSLFLARVDASMEVGGDAP
jgi:hypothetical protein